MGVRPRSPGPVSRATLDASPSLRPRRREGKAESAPGGTFVRIAPVKTQDGRFERLTEVMGRLAVGDRAALERLHAEFGAPIRAAVQGHLRHLGVTRIDPDDVDGLTLDVCVPLAGRAASWDPAHGVTPWTWARLRVRSMVAAHVGLFTDRCPSAARPTRRPPAPVRPGDDDVLAVFGRLAAARPDVGLLHEALARVSRPGQRALLFEVRMQAGQGDPSPAVTVGRARAFGPTPSARPTSACSTRSCGWLTTVPTSPRWPTCRCSRGRPDPPARPRTRRSANARSTR